MAENVSTGRRSPACGNLTSAAARRATLAPAATFLIANPASFRHFERRYAYFLPVTPPIEECLLVPFYVGGKAVGTIWAIAHNDRRKFDAEDMRQLLVWQICIIGYQAWRSWMG